jgi:hypothetical protein
MEHEAAETNDTLLCSVILRSGATKDLLHGD